MEKFGKTVVKARIPILILALILLIPAALGYFHTRTNYDILTYLPKDIETMKGQDILAKDFGTGAFSTVVVEGMKDKDIAAMTEKMAEVPHVKKVLWEGVLGQSLPEQLIPEKYRGQLSQGDAKLLMVIYDTTLSADETLKAVEDLRAVMNEKCFLGGMSAIVVDTKNLSDSEVPVYVAIAVILCLVVLTITMDSFLVPVFFLISIGFAVIYNLGSNVIGGEISYVTKALAAVLQLAVTMDYSIFLWHSYCGKKKENDNNLEAMADAINETLVSVVGSSITTVAGFVALMFMSFTLGLDLGFVMAKGVIIGVICCVTILPSMILCFDKALMKTTHRPFIPDFSRLSKWIVKRFYIFIILAVILVIPAFYGQKHNKVYYNLDTSLPKDLPSIVAGEKLQESFKMNSTHIVMLDSNLSRKDTKNFLKEIENVDGIKKVLGLESFVGSAVPDELIPENLREVVDDGEYKLIFILSEYKVATDEVNRQCDEINKILDKYDDKGMLIGEAPCTKDLITITNHDFNTVNTVSILLVGIIILFVFRSLSLPVLLVSVIEVAIFINMGIPYYTGTTLPFIASIVIGTIQLGSTVDYAILITNKYKAARCVGLSGKAAAEEALSGSVNSIFVSALTFFAATFGVGLYSKIDMISSLCVLMARGAIISMFIVILLLPAVLRLFDGIVVHTSMGFKAHGNEDEGTHNGQLLTGVR
ncbi:MAG: MMPL family transporter [Eubacterium sp.]|nr:MMPL family transporter [Eubacterium sp.]